MKSTMKLLKPDQRSPAEWSTTHGMSSSSTYKIWGGMIQRCTNPKTLAYRYYGGRGINVCAEWLSFTNFLKDMGIRPEGMSLDRIDPDLGYSPDNCRWATSSEQQKNRRDTRLVQLHGSTITLAELSEKTGVSTRALEARIRRGWPDEELSMPPSKSNSITRSRRQQARDASGKFKGENHATA